MRPITLHVEGFGPFRDPITVDFDDVDFFALVGPTGSGKSSVIDAICFALYGSVPRYDDERAVVPAITAGALQATVSLTFETAGTRYVATRVARRTKPPEARLERIGPDGSTKVLAGAKRELGQAVERILGLPFKDFTRCVVLPQGEFARFLHDTPKDREKLLSRLLDLEIYGLMGQRARQVAQRHEAEATTGEQRLERLASATPEAEAAAQRRITEIAGLRDAVNSARPTAEERGRRKGDAEAAVQEARKYAGLLGGVRVPDDVATLGAEIEAAKARVRAAGEGEQAADAELTRCEEAVRTLPPETELATAAQAHEELSTIGVKLEAAEARLATAAAGEKSARAAREAAEAGAKEAEAGLQTARTAHAAHALAAELTVGEPCPVCEQVVRELPQRAPVEEIAAAERASNAAAKTLKDAGAAHEKASSELAGAKAALDGLRSSEAQWGSRVGAYPDRAALDELRERVRQAAGGLEAAKKQTQQVRSAKSKEEKSLGKLEEARRRAELRFGEQRDPIVPLAPPARTGDLFHDWGALAVWAGSEQAAQEKAAAEATGQAEVLRAEQAAANAELRGAFSAVGLDPAAVRTLDDLAQLAAAEHARAEEALASLRRDREEAAELRVKIKAARDASALAATLGKLLGAPQFGHWLVGAALRNLVDGASGTLFRMSGGQFSLQLADDGADFCVVDHRNADEVRSARTLSGGETFQASLALALALAEQLAGLAVQSGTRLDSIFLDEGFGTLDPETLDVVADTIESLGSEDRMVGIVTHVRDLAERVPVRYEVRKGPRTSTIERVEP